MEIDKLTEAGLTKREAHAYLALLELEEAKAGDIAQRTREDRTNIYDSLRSLVKKGLVSYSIKKSKTYYRAAAPERLLSYLSEKEKIIQEMLPDLNKIYGSFQQKPIIETYEGKEGIKTVLNDILNEGKEFVGFGATDRMYKLLPEYAPKYLKQREIKKIHARQFHAKGEKVLESMYSSFKSIPKEFSGPATTLIYADKVAIFMWFIAPPVVVLIKNKEAAKAYKNQFEFMWKMVK